MSHSNRHRNRNFQQPGQRNGTLAAEVADLPTEEPTMPSTTHPVSTGPDGVEEMARELLPDLAVRYASGYGPERIVEMAYELADAFAKKTKQRRSPTDKHLQE